MAQPKGTARITHENGSYRELFRGVRAGETSRAKPQGLFLVREVPRILLTWEEGEVLRGREEDDPLSRVILIIPIIEPAHEVMRPADRTVGRPKQQFGGWPTDG